MCCGFLGSYMLKGHVPMCPKGFKFPGPKPVRLQGFMISDASFVSRDHISRGVKQWVCRTWALAPWSGVRQLEVRRNFLRHRDFSVHHSEEKCFTYTCSGFGFFADSWDRIGFQEPIFLLAAESYRVPGTNKKTKPGCSDDESLQEIAATGSEIASIALCFGTCMRVSFNSALRACSEQACWSPSSGAAQDGWSGWLEGSCVGLYPIDFCNEMDLFVRCPAVCSKKRTAATMMCSDGWKSQVPFSWPMVKYNRVCRVLGSESFRGGTSENGRSSQ